MRKKIAFLTIFMLFFNIIFSINIVRAHDVELDPEGYISMPMVIWDGKGTINVSDKLSDSAYELYYQSMYVGDSVCAQISNAIDVKDEYANEEKTKLNEEKANIDILESEYENILKDSTATEDEKQAAKEKYEKAVDDYNAHVDAFNDKMKEYDQAIKALKPSYDESNWIKTEDGKFEIDRSEFIGKFNYILWTKLVIGTETYYDEGLYIAEGTKEITITLDKTTATMEIGDTLKLKATTNSSDNVTWSSNKTDVATVDAEGNVTAIAKGAATITATVGEKSATCTVTVNSKETTDGTEDEKPTDDDKQDDEEREWTDFSNAKFELKKDGVSDAIIEISTVTPKSNSYYYLVITHDSSKPNLTDITSEKKIGLMYDEESKMFKTTNSDEVARYVELNQDLYVSVLEERGYQNENVVIHGKKLERYEEPRYSNAFFATFMTRDESQLVTQFTHSRKNNRNTQIKVGKITDTSILQKIKNKDSSGFANLLSYANSNNGIYDKIIAVDEGSADIEYASYINDKSAINLNGLENGAYYFLYMKADDENGKYIPQESVTLAQAKVHDDGQWYLFFYGSEDFKWADFGSIEPDDTVIKDKIPQAGLNTIVWITLGIATFGVFAYKQYRKNNF